MWLPTSQCSVAVLTLLQEPPAIPIEIPRFPGVTAAKPLNRLTKNLTWVITSEVSPLLPKFKTICPLGAYGRSITLVWYVVFLFCDPKFCLHPKKKPWNWFLCGLVHMMPILGYCIPRGINMQKVFVFPIFNPETAQKGAWIVVFKPNAQNIHFVLSERLMRFQPNFAQWWRPPNTLCGLFQNLPHKSKIGGWPPSWKTLNVISLQPFSQFWRNLVWRYTLALPTWHSPKI